ncbi:MAG TPA: hypothetical protein VMV83_07765 [Rectinemataceae bacterium]|nr:hypothetical protein [Rectinemataceae bacterium]
MSSLVRCKACGYIMEAADLGEVCPACGVPARQFEPYDDKVSEKRRRLLDLHIHPVIVHAPQAFALALVVLAIIIAFSVDGFRTLVTDTARSLGVALPLTVLAAFVSGQADAKLRFRKTTTPILLRKKRYASLFFVFSLLVAWMALMSPLDNLLTVAIFGLLSAASLGCGAMLGILGTPLLVAKFPG